jgi:drug/metabolite transporter (DMT)-like permease
LLHIFLAVIPRSLIRNGTLVFHGAFAIGQNRYGLLKIDFQTGIEMTNVDANPFRGILLKVLSVIVFLIMATCIKLTGDGIATGQITFFRSLFAVVPILAYLAWRGQLRTAFHTKSIGGQIVRGLVGITAMTLSFYGLVRLPLPEAISIGYAMPLFSVIFAALFLNETVRIYRLSAVAVGLTGVLIISWPKLTLIEGGASNEMALGALALIGSAILGATAMILVRKLVKTETSATIVLYFSLTASVFSLFSVPFGWSPMSYQQAMLLIISGFCGGIGQILLTESYRYAEVSVIAPFEYVSIVFGLIVSYFLFGEVPQAMMLVGTAIVISAGIFIIYRERQLGLERKSMRKHVTPQG